MARNPINQRIVAGEPVVSKNGRAGGVQSCDIEFDCHRVTRREENVKVNALSNDGSGGSVKQTEADRRNRNAREIIGGTKNRVYEAVRRTGVH